MPRLRRITMACSTSPFDSVSAFLQSIMGAPVLSRSSRTCVAEMLPGFGLGSGVPGVVLIIADLSKECLLNAPPGGARRIYETTRAGTNTRVNLALDSRAGPGDSTAG